MKNKALPIIIVIALIAVGGGAYAYTSRPNSNHNSMTMAAGHSMAMTNLLKAQTGDAYDKMFITMMSEHHAGAVAMAKLVLNDGKHAEVRTLAQGIISAQTKELADMKAWAASWGYTYSEPDSGVITAATASMKGLKGDKLDEQFLSDMMGHHNDAIDMAVLSANRANHQEIKTLSANIISTQSEEITRMQQLMDDYGYKTSGGMSHGSNHRM